MKTAQQRIIEAIEAKINHAAIYESAIAANYSNTGTILIYRKADPVQAIGSIAFNFQSDTYTLSIKWQGKGVPSQAGRADYFDFYQGYDQPTRFWDVLAATIQPSKVIRANRK